MQVLTAIGYWFEVTSPNLQTIKLDDGAISVFRSKLVCSQFSNTEQALLLISQLLFTSIHLHDTCKLRARSGALNSDSAILPPYDCCMICN